MTDLPFTPEYDDRSDHDQYGLVMPFKCVSSVGGPFDDLAFVAGFQVGAIDARLAPKTIAATTDLFYAALEEQLDLVAMRHGYTMNVLTRHADDDRYGGWIHVGFTRVTETEAV